MRIKNTVYEDEILNFFFAFAEENICSPLLTIVHTFHP